MVSPKPHKHLLTGYHRFKHLSMLLVLLLVFLCTCQVVCAQQSSSSVRVLNVVFHKNTSCDSGIAYRRPVHALGPQPTLATVNNETRSYASVNCISSVLTTTSTAEGVEYSSYTRPLSCLPGSATSYECSESEYNETELLQVNIGYMIYDCPTELSRTISLTITEQCTASVFSSGPLGHSSFWKTIVDGENITIAEFNDDTCQQFRRNYTTKIDHCFDYPIPGTEDLNLTSGYKLSFRRFNYSGDAFGTFSPAPATLRPTFATFSPVVPTTFAPVPAVTNPPTGDRGYIFAYYTNDPHLFRYKYSGSGQIVSSSYITCNGTGWRSFAQSSRWIVRVHETSRFFSSGSASSVDAVQIQMLDSTNNAVMLDSSEGITGWTTRQTGEIQVLETMRGNFMGQPYIYTVEIKLSDLKLTISRFPWTVQSGAFVHAPLNVALLSGSVVEGIAVDGCPLDGFAISVDGRGRRQIQESGVPTVTVTAHPICANVDPLFRDACDYDIFATGDLNFFTATVKASETFNEVKLQADLFDREGNAEVLAIFNSIVVLFVAATFVM